MTWTEIAVDERKMREMVSLARKAGMTYKLGAKAPSLSCVPGQNGWMHCDCSGWVRASIYQATTGKVVMPDGSFFQAEWARKQGFKKSTSDACLLHDGRVRLAYWHNSGGISHIMLVLNGKTLESCGSKGPTRRTWSMDTNFMRDSEVWVLEMDQDEAGSE